MDYRMSAISGVIERAKREKKPLPVRAALKGLEDSYNGKDKDSCDAKLSKGSDSKDSQ